MKTKETLDITPKTFPQFEKSHACFIVTSDKDFNGIECPKIYIQSIDAYGRQHEFSLGLIREAGKSDIESYHWEFHAYRHAGIRRKEKLPKKQGERAFLRFIHLAENYPSLMFNKQDEHIGQNAGFTKFNEGVLFSGLGFEKAMEYYF
jgi:hypothetical protein